MCMYVFEPIIMLFQHRYHFQVSVERHSSNNKEKKEEYVTSETHFKKHI
jgi:hypothetical protein